MYRYIVFSPIFSNFSKNYNQSPKYSLKSYEIPNFWRYSHEISYIPNVKIPQKVLNSILRHSRDIATVHRVSEGAACRAGGRFGGGPWGRFCLEFQDLLAGFLLFLKIFWGIWNIWN